MIQKKKWFLFFSFICLGFLWHGPPLPSQTVAAALQKQVYVCGNPVGIHMESEGVMVLGTDALKTEYGTVSSPAEGLVQKGDYIVKVNGETVNRKEEFLQMIQKYGNDKVILTIKRKGYECKIQVRPVKLSKDGDYKVGIWIKDDCQGIGTMTYIDGQHFGALGHGVTDPDAGERIDIHNGQLYSAQLLSIVKGENGTPGELVGTIQYGNRYRLGIIESNTEVGIYGMTDEVWTEERLEKTYGPTMDVAGKDEVQTGKAFLRSWITGEAVDYEIEILKTDSIMKNKQRGMLIKVTDPRLLRETGGIIQGMSGSPILQNGKLIGAVTHVLVNDPTKGYGIFIENMLGH
ncbi:MAG: SpoIVB peptidase [Lachnospiraceae bacterium]